MHLAMFDIDDTLVDTENCEDHCFIRAIEGVLGEEVNPNWSEYPNVTDSGIVDFLAKNVGTVESKDQLISDIKIKFREYLLEHFSQFGVNEVPGASRLLAELVCRSDMAVCIATGGWRSTAELKLESVGIDFSDIVIASSDDHIERAKIMKICEERSGVTDFASRTYFGDASWDKKAASDLGYNFVLVGSKIEHCPNITNFTNKGLVLTAMGI